MENVCIQFLAKETKKNYRRQKYVSMIQRPFFIINPCKDDPYYQKNHGSKNAYHILYEHAFP